MSENVKMDGIQFEIVENSGQAVDGLAKLETTLKRLGRVMQHGLQAKRPIADLRNLGTEAERTAAKLLKLVEATGKLKDIKIPTIKTPKALEIPAAKTARETTKKADTPGKDYSYLLDMSKADLQAKKLELLEEKLRGVADAAKELQAVNQALQFKKLEMDANTAQLLEQAAESAGSSFAELDLDAMENLWRDVKRREDS